MGDSGETMGLTVAGARPNDAELPRPGREALQAEGPARTDRVDTERHAGTAWLFHLDDSVRQVELSDVRQLAESEENFIWVDVSEYSQVELREVADAVGVHPDALRLTLAARKRPRLDVYGSVFFVAVTVPYIDQERYRAYVSQLDLFVHRNYVVSAHKRPLPFADDIMSRARHNPGLMQADSAFLLYIILDELLGYYEDLMDEVEDEIEDLEERALLDTSDQFLTDVVRFKRYVYAVSRLAAQHREVFAAFLRPDFPYVSGDQMTPYVRELLDRLLGLLDMLDRAKESVNGAFDIYVSHVSHRTNQIIKVLTVVSSILFAVSAIIAFFSADFRSIPLHTPTSFAVMLALIAATVLIALFLFHRKGWI